MRNLTAMLILCLMCLLETAACSREEPLLDPPQKPQKIKIVKPAEVEEPENQKASIPSVQEKGGISAKEPDTDRAAVVGEVPEKVLKEEGATKKDAEGAKTGLVDQTAKKQAEDIKTAEVEEKQARMQEQATGGKQAGDEKTERYYIVKKGESLYDVASREDVYGNKLKWPILYRHNLDTLGCLNMDIYLAERDLPAGLKLRIISRDEVENNLRERQNRMWVVNALSVSTDGEISPLAITLMKNGSNAYLAQAAIKGKEWTRLRVGFFASRAEADAEKEKIKDLLQIGDPWSIKLTDEEFEAFAGY